MFVGGSEDLGVAFGDLVWHLVALGRPRVSLGGDRSSFSLA